MTAMQRQRVVWTGFKGAPGLTTFYFNDAAASQGAVHNFWSAMAVLLPSVVTISIEPGGDVIEDTTGALTGVWAGSLQAPIVGGAVGGVYSAPAGLLVRWETLVIRSGSRLRGRTFVVPVVTGAYQSDGTLEPASLAAAQLAASDFVGAVTPNMLVWQRPRVARAASVNGYGKPSKALAGRAGSSGVVVQSSVPDEAVVLRSRRD